MKVLLKTNPIILMKFSLYEINCTSQISKLESQITLSRFPSVFWDGTALSLLPGLNCVTLEYT
jgi:hypothetical protein